MVCCPFFCITGYWFYRGKLIPGIGCSGVGAGFGIGNWFWGFVGLRGQARWPTAYCQLRTANCLLPTGLKGWHLGRLEVHGIRVLWAHNLVFKGFNFRRSFSTSFWDEASGYCRGCSFVDLLI